jgi:uncharacterized membrane-anchored protein YhcB (DUF1043 family)
MFRFTIRDVLWLTALVALAIGWWVDRTALRLANEQLEQQAQDSQAGWMGS